jgi:hypothetical protein
MAQYVQVRIEPNPEAKYAHCVTYFDPRYTSDVPRPRVKKDPQAELEENQKWMAGLQYLRGAKVPLWYIQKIRNQILGAFRDPEPIFIRPSEVFIKATCHNPPSVRTPNPALVSAEQRQAQPAKGQAKSM